MELYLSDAGAYAPGTYAGLRTVSGAQELAQRLTMRLRARRGAFAPLPDYGSRLYTLTRDIKPSNREPAARQFVAEALSGEAGIEIKSVAYRDADMGAGIVTVTLDASGVGITLTVDI